MNKNVIDQVNSGQHAKSYGRNFKPLIAAGSWTISGFHYGNSRCGCCMRPIHHVLHLKNSSHAQALERDPLYSFAETIDIGVVCGPKVFMESCVGFYTDPEREWERQFASWKDYINYIVLCAKGDEIWKLVPSDVRTRVDSFLEEGYKTQAHTGPWHLVKDAKKRYLRLKRSAEHEPFKGALSSQLRSLLWTTKRLLIVPNSWNVTYDMVLEKNEETT